MSTSLCWQLLRRDRRRGMNDHMFLRALLCPVRAHKWQAACDLHYWKYSWSLILKDLQWVQLGVQTPILKLKWVGSNHSEDATVEIPTRFQEVVIHAMLYSALTALVKEIKPVNAWALSFQSYMICCCVIARKCCMSQCNRRDEEEENMARSKREYHKQISRCLSQPKYVFSLIKIFDLKLVQSIVRI